MSILPPTKRCREEIEDEVDNDDESIVIIETKVPIMVAAVRVAMQKHKDCFLGKTYLTLEFVPDKIIRNIARLYNIRSTVDIEVVRHDLSVALTNPDYELICKPSQRHKKPQHVNVTPTTVQTAPVVQATTSGGGLTSVAIPMEMQNMAWLSKEMKRVLDEQKDLVSRWHENIEEQAAERLRTFNQMLIQKYIAEMDKLLVDI